MSLLDEIHLSILDENVDVGTILLKLRYLANRLKSGSLDEWVQYEIEGYPEKALVPYYRIAQVTYTGTFIDNFRQLSDTPIPNILIEELAGNEWVSYKIRDSLPLIDSMLERYDSKEGSFEVANASDLILILQDKIYPSMSILSIRCKIDSIAFTRVQTAVRIKVQDLALRLEEEFPEVADITVGRNSGTISVNKQEDVNQLVQQTIFGDITNIGTGDGSAVSVNVVKGDQQVLINALEDAGLPSEKAKELATIIEKENPQDKDNPIGEKAQKWLKNHLKDGVMVIGRISKSVLETAIYEAIKQFYGL